VRVTAKARLFAGLAACGVAVWAAPARADLRTGLIGYWKLDEATIAADTVAADASGKQHPGVYVGGPTTSTKVPPVTFGDPRSVAFVRASHHAVQVAEMPEELKPAAVTISAWCLATTTDTDRSEIVSGGDSYILYITKTGVGAGRRQVGTWSDVTATASVLDGKWHHLAATIDAEALKVFVDGTFMGAEAAEGALTYDVGTDLWLGRYGYGTRPRDFEGNLDDVALYGRVLTADEIADLAHGAEPGVVAAPPAPDAGATGMDAAPELPPEAPAPPTPDAAVEAPPVVSEIDASVAPEAAPPVVTPPPVDAAAPAINLPPDARPPGKLVHRYHDVPPACAVGGGDAGVAALLLVAALLAVSGRSRRAPASHR
jgi:hypothetical protein